MTLESFWLHLGITSAKKLAYSSGHPWSAWAQIEFIMRSQEIRILGPKLRAGWFLVECILD